MSEWPKHKNGRDKTIAEMTRKERIAVGDAFSERMKLEFESRPLSAGLLTGEELLENLQDAADNAEFPAPTKVFDHNGDYYLKTVIEDQTIGVRLWPITTMVERDLIDRTFYYYAQITRQFMEYYKLPR